MTHIHFGPPTACTAFRSTDFWHRFLALSYFERLSRRTSTRKRSLCRFGPAIPPLFENEWVEMGDPAPLRRRTHGGAGAGALALVKPLPPEAVAGRQALQGPSVPAHNRHQRTDGQRFNTSRSRQSLLLGTTSPIRNSKEPQFRIKGQLWREKYQSALLDCELHLVDLRAFSRECLLALQRRFKRGKANRVRPQLQTSTYMAKSSSTSNAPDSQDNASLCRRICAPTAAVLLPEYPPASG